jgi:membrane protein implicated in regulation of membrane protease activity
MTVIFWAVAVVAFIILELATVGLASIWFALGALCALIAALLGAPLWLQIVWFVIISVATLLLTRPLAKKYINSKTMATNADRVIGRRAVVKERIDELSGTGAVLADGKMWSARTVDGRSAEPGDVVIVREIRGVKLIVEPPDAEATAEETTEE